MTGGEGVGEGAGGVDAAALVDGFACAWVLFLCGGEVEDGRGGVEGEEDVLGLDV